MRVAFSFTNHKKGTQHWLCSLFVLPRRTRTVSSAMWACALRAPAELCAEGASPARGSSKLNASRVDSDAIAPLPYAAANDALFGRCAPYESARGSQKREVPKQGTSLFSCASQRTLLVERFARRQ